MAAVASLANVTKSYPGTVALAGISLEIEAGEAVALLGPNGSGKTTCIEVLLGLRPPDSGEARLFGLDPRSRRARWSVGLTPQLMDFPLTLTVREVLTLVRAYYPHPAALEDLLERFELGPISERRTGGLSGGQARRLALALAFVGAPQFVVLDEPTGGLDAQTRRRFWEVLEDFSVTGRTLLLATHDFLEAEALATRVVVIRAGMVLASGSPQEVRERAGFERVTVRATSIPEVPGVLRRERIGRLFELYVESADRVVAELVSRGIPLSAISVEPVTLESAFLSMVGEQS